MQLLQQQPKKKVLLVKLHWGGSRNRDNIYRAKYVREKFVGGN